MCVHVCVCDLGVTQEHVHKNLAKVAANLQGGMGSSLSSGGSIAMPLQPSSLANLNREASTESSKGSLMDKLQGIRSTYMTASSATDSAAPAPSVSTQEPTKALSKSVTSLSSFMSGLSASTAAESCEAGDNTNTPAALAEAEAADGAAVRASQSVLSLQERLAKLRA